MLDNKVYVITSYGNNEKINKIMVSSFENSQTNADEYCYTTNILELEEDAWIYAKKISTDTQYSIDELTHKQRFTDLILNLDDKVLQNKIRECDISDIVRALANAKEEAKEKIYKNMSKRTAKTVKEDIEYLDSVRTVDSDAAQDRIIKSICKFKENDDNHNAVNHRYRQLQGRRI
jgi:hypothetical protein